MKKEPEASESPKAFKSYEDFKKSTLLNPGNMPYVENAFEALIEGEDCLLREPLSSYMDVPTQHRRICETLIYQQQFIVKQPEIQEMRSAYVLIDHYMRYGHLSVDLGLFHDMRSPIAAPEISGVLGANLQGIWQTLPAEGWHKLLSSVYQNDIGFEFSHTAPNEQVWFEDLIASDHLVLSQDECLKAYADLYRAEQLERHLGIQFVGQKRFSLEGCEAFIPCIEKVIIDSVERGSNDFVIGMAHRGRLNTMVNVLGVSVATLMSEFEGAFQNEATSGDVKYHLGHSVNREHDNKPFHIALAYNPSHLEAINAVVMGNIRARIDRAETVPAGILIHGDASIAGQGVVMENLSMSQVPSYHIGGVVHIVINNQVGFTTNPQDARSSDYCTDIAKMIAAPIMHVSCSNMMAVLKVAKLASMYRQEFKKDVFIDLIGYRKYGHNEADEPRATQPVMYQQIKSKKLVSLSFRSVLVEQGVSEQALEEVEARVARLIKEKACLIDCDHEAQSTRHRDWVNLSQEEWDSEYLLPYKIQELSNLAVKMLDIPAGVKLQKQVENLQAQRQEMALGKQDLNWGMAELLAYQTLLEIGHPVRLVGQDAIRGTFAHRHASVFDQESGEKHCLPKSGPESFFANYNAVLSEYAALGFEYGYAETSPNALVVFEAQFGDFINGAQIIVDQFISSGYQKWQRHCGLVMLLPHGYEGQGPEHSSARMERFLQLCAEDNMQICVPSTPHQIFHVLIRQVLRAYRTPLVIFSPKSLLRHPLAVSSLKSIAEGKFLSCISDETHLTAKKVVLCSGRIYYDLCSYRDDNGHSDVALLRIEQLHPFPGKDITCLLKRYKQMEQLIWCQDEPQNQGAFDYMSARLKKLLPDTIVECVSRDASAAPSVGYMSKHKEQQSDLLKKIFDEEIK